MVRNLRVACWVHSEIEALLSLSNFLSSDSIFNMIGQVAAIHLVHLVCTVHLPSSCVVLLVCVCVRVCVCCLLYTSPSPRDATLSRMPSSA